MTIPPTIFPTGYTFSVISTPDLSQPVVPCSEVVDGGNTSVFLRVSPIGESSHRMNLQPSPKTQRPGRDRYKVSGTVRKGGRSTGSPRCNRKGTPVQLLRSTFSTKDSTATTLENETTLVTPETFTITDLWTLSPRFRFSFFSSLRILSFVTSRNEGTELFLFKLKNKFFCHGY